MVHYEYVGRLSEQTLLCISVVESEDAGKWMVLAQLLIVASHKGRTGRVELARASYDDPLEAAEEAIALSHALQQTAEERRLGPINAAERVKRPLG